MFSGRGSHKCGNRGRGVAIVAAPIGFPIIEFPVFSIVREGLAVPTIVQVNGVGALAGLLLSAAFVIVRAVKTLIADVDSHRAVSGWPMGACVFL